MRLLRVLKNKISRILMIVFANDALDHLLGNVVDAGITNQVAGLGSRYANDVCSSDFTICATKSVPEPCRMHTWSSGVPAHSSHFRGRIGAPRRSTRSSIQDRVMESAVRFAQGHWEARLCMSL